jgi:NADH-quinone oxidoreductase subunit E
VNELQREYPEEIERILAKYPPEYKRSAVMPLLYLAQRRQGYIPPQAIEEIAQILGLSTTEVASVAGFYSLFHEEPGGRWRIQVCTDLPCALRGADEFLKNLCEALGVTVGGTTTDGLFTVEEVKCLAACHRAPVFQLQSGSEIKYYENQSIDTVLALVEELRRRAESEKEGV